MSRIALQQRGKKIIVAYISILCWRIMVSKVFFDKNWIRHESCTSRITLKARSWLLLKLTSISSVHRNRSWPVRGHVTKNRTLVRRKADVSCIAKIISLIYLKSYLNLISIILTLLLLSSYLFSMWFLI